MQPEAIAGLAMSALALIVAIWAAMQTSRAARTQNDIHGRLLELEVARDGDERAAANRARLGAAVIRSGSRTTLRIANRGSAVARELQVLVDRVPASDHEVVLQGQTEVTTIGPGAEIEYLLVPTMASPDVIDVILKWADDSGVPRQWGSQLRLA